MITLYINNDNNVYKLVNSDEMLKTLMTEERLKELFIEVDKETNSFTNFPPKSLMRNPNRLIVFRLALGLSLKEFSDLFDLHFDTISQHERISNKSLCC